MSQAALRSSKDGTTNHVESQLLGSILHDSEEHDDHAQPLQHSQPHDALPDSALIRATSAPPLLSQLDEASGEATGPDDIRLTEEYYAYYYSQRPLDPRLPRPLFNFKYQRMSPTVNISQLNGPAMAAAAVAAQQAAEAKNRSRNGDTGHAPSSSDSLSTFDYDVTKQLGQLSFHNDVGSDVPVVPVPIMSPSAQPPRPASGQAGFLQRVASPPISASNRSSSNLDGFSFSGNSAGAVGSGFRPNTSPSSLGPLSSPSAAQSPMMAVMGYGTAAATRQQSSDSSPTALGQAAMSRSNSSLGLGLTGGNDQFAPSGMDQNLGALGMGLGTLPMNSPTGANQAAGGSRSPTLNQLGTQSPLAGGSSMSPWIEAGGDAGDLANAQQAQDDLAAQQQMGNMQQQLQMMAMLQLQLNMQQQMGLNPLQVQQMQQMQQQLNPLLLGMAPMNPMLAGQLSPMNQAMNQQMQQLMSQMTMNQQLAGQMNPMSPLGMQNQLNPMGMTAGMGNMNNMNMMGMNMMGIPGLNQPAAAFGARGINMAPNARGGGRPQRRNQGPMGRGYGGGGRWGSPENPMFDSEVQDNEGGMGSPSSFNASNSPYAGNNNGSGLGGAASIRAGGKLRPAVNPLLGLGMGMDSMIGGGLRKSGDDTGFGFSYSDNDRMNRSPRNNRRNAWMDEFRLNKGNSNMTLQHVVDRGLVVELATDQYGSRFIQQRLESASPDEKAAAFQQLLPETLTLCTDVFGNYVVQKFLEFGTTEQKKLVINKLLGSILPLSLQMYGCRVVQKSIDVADLQQQSLIVRELVGHVMQCVKDQNGNHVIQKCIEKVPSQLIQFIVEAFVNQIYHLSTHPYGCRVIQRLLEHCSEEQRNSILSEILDNTHELCKNQYGNYVIQHVLIHGTPWHKGAVMQSLRGTLLPLSKHKFASNVIEKCFAHANRQDRAALLEEVLGKDDDGNSPLIAMVKDQFANYVIQTMIDVVDDEQRELIVNRIRRHVPNLRKIPYGKHIISRIERLTGKPILP